MGGTRWKGFSSQHGRRQYPGIYPRKLAARIATKARTFLVKVKAHRGEPLNEGSDDLTKGGEGVQMETDDDTSGVLVL